MQRGFTLIELMIVIAIIGILAAVVYPFLARMAGVEVSPRPIGARDFSIGKPETVIRCQDGLVVKDGNVVVENGAAVKC